MCYDDFFKYSALVSAAGIIVHKIQKVFSFTTMRKYTSYIISVYLHIKAYYCQHANGNNNTHETKKRELWEKPKAVCVGELKWSHRPTLVFFSLSQRQRPHEVS